MTTKTLFGSKLREKTMKGVREIVDAVTMTLGPSSRTVGIAKAVPTGVIFERVIVKDGVTVAKAIDPEDPFENFAVNILKEAALKQVSDVGDGTTAVMCLAGALMEQGNQLISAGVKPMILKKGLEEGAKKLVKELETLAIPVKTLQEKIQVATISAEDPELGKLVAETLDNAGEDGVVTVDSSKGTEVAIVEKQEGMQIDKGWASPYFVTDPDNMIATLENTSILVTDQRIDSLNGWDEFFKDVVDVNKVNTITIIAPDFSDMALAVLINNKARGAFQALAVKAPYFGNIQKDFLQDIAVLTGATLISADAGKKLTDTRYPDLGKAKYISSKKDTTVIIGGSGDLETIKSRIKTIKNTMEQTDQNFDKEKLKERLGKLTGKISIIKVGGNTEIEMKERKERVIDAVEATKAATKTGIVPGGEVVYLKIRKILNTKDFAEKMLYDALEAPFNTLLNNAGLNPGTWMERIQNTVTIDNAGVDVMQESITDMIKSGIVDPLAVPSNAILNATSVAVQLLTTDAISVPIADPLAKKQ